LQLQVTQRQIQNINRLLLPGTKIIMSGREIPQTVKDSVAATKAEYVQLGKSGLRVSVPILGAMSFGDPKWAPWVIDEEKVSSKILKANTSPLAQKTDPRNHRLTRS
jgi:hypothetical protein